MKIKWLFEAQNEYRTFLNYYKVNVGIKYAKDFADKILSSIKHLEEFPEMGVLRQESIMGKHGFRALFIEQYVCIYRIEADIVCIYHIADARKNYIYNIFGLE